MEYLIVRLSAKVTPRFLIENEELREGDRTIKKIMHYEVLFPADVVDYVEKDLRVIVKRVKDRINRLAPLRIANLELFPVDKREQIVEILERGKEEYWNKIKELAEQFNADIEKLNAAMYFRYNIFTVVLPERLVHIQAIDTVLSEIKGLKEFLEKYRIPDDHIKTIKKVEELIEDEDLPEDLREAVLKIISVAFDQNGKVRQRAKTFLRKLRDRVGDAPIVKLLDELINAVDPNEAIKRVSDVIAREKYVRRIEILEEQISNLKMALERAEEEKKKILEDAKRRINELKQQLETLERERSEQQNRRLNLDLEEISLELNTLREVGKKVQDLELLKGLDEIEIRLDNIKRRKERKINIEL